MTTKKLSQTVSPITFFGSAIIALALIAYASLKPESAAELFKHANDWVIAEAGWFYLLAVGFFVVFLLGLAISPYGRIKLGPDDSSPDYSYGTWAAMLFSAGMGIGIVFYGVAEPITHFSQPPDAEPRSIQAMRDAMEITYFHWGVHAWAIYALLGMCLAYFGYRKNQPLSLRSALYPLIGERVNGPIGSIVDIFAVVGTLAGLATSLGLGVSQLNASLNYLFGLTQSLDMQLWLILIVTILATFTVATGLDAGVRRLSEFIIVLSFVLMFLLLCLGPSAFLMSAFVENLGLYLSGFIGRTFHVYAYDPTPWVGKWTLFYWGWWVSWAPFVGLFIARISRGRTIRQFLLGVLFAPAGFSFIWFTIFGDLAMWLDINRAGGAISETVSKDMSIALFTVFEYLPWSQVLAWMTGILVAVYFVTASDAGALVIAMITARNNDEDEPALWLRVFWALTCGAVAACLLLAGGLPAAGGWPGRRADGRADRGLAAGGGAVVYLLGNLEGAVRRGLDDGDAVAAVRAAAAVRWPGAMASPPERHRQPPDQGPGEPLHREHGETGAQLGQGGAGASRIAGRDGRAGRWGATEGVARRRHPRVPVCRAPPEPSDSGVRAVGPARQQGRAPPLLACRGVSEQWRPRI